MNNFNLEAMRDSDRGEHRFVMVNYRYGFAVYRNNKLCMLERNQTGMFEGVYRTLSLLGFKVSRAKVNENALDKNLKGFLGFPENLTELVKVGAVVDEGNQAPKRI